MVGRNWNVHLRRSLTSLAMSQRGQRAGEIIMKLGRLNVLTAPHLLAQARAWPWLNRARHRPLATRRLPREPGQVLGQRSNRIMDKSATGIRREGRDGLGRHGVGLVIDRQRVEHTGTAQRGPRRRPACRIAELRRLTPKSRRALRSRRGFFCGRFRVTASSAVELKAEN